MMTIRAGVKVHIALGVTDMRKGLDGLVQGSGNGDAISQAANGLP